MKKSTKQTFIQIMDLSEEIALQISLNGLTSPYYKGDTQTFLQDTKALLKCIVDLSAEINRLAQDKIK